MLLTCIGGVYTLTKVPIEVFLYIVAVKYK